MIVLGIDGALHGTFSVAIARDRELLTQSHLTGNVALERGLELIARSMEEAGIALGAVDRVAVGTGPGGFTGLRIAVSYAKSLAQAWAIPLAGISSFDLLEAGLNPTRCLTVVVGRPGVISVRLRADTGEPARASGPTAQIVAKVATLVNRGDPLPIVGAPEDVLAAFAEGGFIVQPYPPATGSAAVAAALIANGVEPSANLHEVRTDYGELPAAKVPARR